MLVMLAVLWTVVDVPFCTVVRYAMPYLAVLFCFSAAGALELLPRAGLGRIINAAVS